MHVLRIIVAHWLKIAVLGCQTIYMFDIYVYIIYSIVYILCMSNIYIFVWYIYDMSCLAYIIYTIYDTYAVYITYAIYNILYNCIYTIWHTHMRYKIVYIQYNK